MKINLTASSKTINTVSIENIFKANDFIFSKRPTYTLAKLRDSESTLYVRLYENRIECVLYGDYDYHVYMKISNSDFLKRIKDENIFYILLKDKK